MLLQTVARIADRPVERARSDGQRARQEHLRLLVSHAAREVAVGRADAAYGCVEPAEGVARAAQTSSTRRLADLGAVVQEDLLKRLPVDALGLQSQGDLAGCRDDERI